MASALPKLSYVLLSHNREKYIRAAVENAFAQEYEGELEYIFSDDCSTDNTYAIIQECVREYKGNRRVVVTQTPANCHLAGNTNHAVSFVENDWIVRADDDDYSSIDRCALIGRAIAEYPDCRYVTTGVRPFTDAQDESMRLACMEPCGADATFRKVDIHTPGNGSDVFNSVRYSYKAWHREVYSVFGPLDRNAYYVDDLTCYRRANVLGSGVYIEHAPAVFLREGSGNMSRGGDDFTRGYNAIIRLEKFNDKYLNITYIPLLQEWEKYCRYVREHFSDEEAQALAPFLRQIEQDSERRKLMATYWRQGCLNRWRIASRMRPFGAFEKLRCLPMPLFAVALAFFRFFKDRLPR